MSFIQSKVRFRPSVTEITCLVLGELFVFWYAWLIDDAYLYFRYVDNFLIHGQGLVWNSGEWVEGFSSPLWMILLVSLRALKLNYWLTVRLVGMLSYALFWWIACLINRRLTVPTGKRVMSVNIPLIFLTFTYGVSCYFTSGLESPLVIILAAVYAGIILWPRSLFLQLLLGISPMVRHELTIPFLLVLLYFFVKLRRIPIPAILSFVTSMGSYMLFRVWYYADLFPNTFYLKDLIWVRQGLNYLYETSLAYQIIPYLLSACVVYMALQKVDGPKLLLRGKRSMMILAALPMVCYVVKIGGDPRHFRFLAFPYCLIVLATGGLLESLMTKWPKYNSRYIAALALIFALAVGMNFPRQLNQHPIFRDHFNYQHRAFLLIYDSARHRLNQNTPFWTSGGEELSWNAAMKRYRDEGNSDEVLCQYRCRIGYLRPAVPIIQSLGLAEPFLARTLMPSDRPAHKWGLIQLAKDIAAIRTEYGFRRGAFQDAMANNPTPWIVLNMEQIRKIEHKAYNNHKLRENLRLAFSPIERIDPNDGRNLRVGGAKAGD